MLIFLTCIAVSGRSQSPSQNRADKRDDQSGTIRVDTDLVLVDVKVIDRGDGRTVTGLRVDEFNVYEDGKRQQIALFSAADVPLSLALVIDTSGSTAGEMGLIRKAARRFLDELRPKDRVAVVAFSQEIELLSDLTSDRRKLERALEDLKPGSGTAFYDALVVTVEDVLKRAEGRKAVVMMTDGVDSIGHFTYKQIMTEVERSQAPLYFLELDTAAFTEERLLLDCNEDRHFRLSRKQLRKYGERFDPNALWWLSQDYCRLARDQKQLISRRLYEIAHQELSEIADRTGGHAYPVKGLKELGNIYTLIAAELRTQYSIGYYPSNEKHDGKWRSLRVEVKGGTLSVQTKPGYRAPLD